MARTLPSPEVLACYFDDGFQPSLAAMRLRWTSGHPGPADRTWDLPGGLRLVGPPPRQFGLSIHRSGEDAYRVRMLWDRTALSWDGLPRGELLGCSLGQLLEALGTDLWYLLEQPVLNAPHIPDAVA